LLPVDLQRDAEPRRGGPRAALLLGLGNVRALIPRGAGEEDGFRLSVAFLSTANRIEVERQPYAMRSRSMASWSSDMCWTDAFMRSPSSTARREASSASSSSAMRRSDGVTPASQSAAPAAISWRSAFALAAAAWDLAV
jgi:uncharacterized protein (DUF3084 family)